MKKLLSLLISIVFVVCAFGQEKYAVPDVSLENKLDRTYYQLWAMFAAGIDFAEAQDMSPYEYGKYMGKVFAPSWNKDAGFEGFVKGMIYNWECFKTDQDGPLVVRVIDEGTVAIQFPTISWSKYFPEGNPYGTFEEASECLRGLTEVIADYMDCKVKDEITAESIVYVISKKG